MYKLHVNQATVHISGHGIKFNSDDESTMNHCGALTRGRFAVKPGEYETAADALKAAQVDRRKVCKTCEKKTEAAEAAEQEAAETETEVKVDVVGPYLALVSLSDRDGGTLVGQDGRWLAEDSYGSGRIVGSSRMLKEAAKILATHLGVSGKTKILVECEY